MEWAPASTGNPPAAAHATAADFNFLATYSSPHSSHRLCRIVWGFPCLADYIPGSSLVLRLDTYNQHHSSQSPWPLVTSLYCLPTSVLSLECHFSCIFVPFLSLFMGFWAHSGASIPQMYLSMNAQLWSRSRMHWLPQSFLHSCPAPLRALVFPAVHLTGFGICYKWGNIFIAHYLFIQHNYFEFQPIMANSIL